MGAMQRRKGQSGEREIAAIIRDLTGWDCQRRVRQHDGDSDLLGVPGWSIEVKRAKSATRSVKAAWWKQAVLQAGELHPVLAYRLDRDEWRLVWPAAVQLVMQDAGMWRAYEWTVEGSPEVWATVARDLNAR